MWLFVSFVLITFGGCLILAFGLQALLAHFHRSKPDSES